MPLVSFFTFTPLIRRRLIVGRFSTFLFFLRPGASVTSSSSMSDRLTRHPPVSDYPRTLREWGRRLEANLTQEMLVNDFPALKSRSEFDAFKRKWQYLYAYAGAGFAKGYIDCHMLTFIREVRTLLFFSA